MRFFDGSIGDTVPFVLGYGPFRHTISNTIDVLIDDRRCIDLLLVSHSDDTKIAE